MAIQTLVPFNPREPTGSKQKGKMNKKTDLTSCGDTENMSDKQDKKSGQSNNELFDKLLIRRSEIKGCMDSKG